jgi:[ribosomal protein S5]-alanine N-acetyltransferase
LLALPGGGAFQERLASGTPTWYPKALMPALIQSRRLDLMPLTPPVLRALLAGDVRTAGHLLGATVPGDLEIPADAMELRLSQLEADPGLQPWLMRAMVLRETGIVVGDIGFHAAPGHECLAELAPGGAELGFGVAAAWRRRGFASEASEALMRWACENHGVRQFVVSISPGNRASLGLAAKLGFQKIGSHLDEIDGPEDIFALTLPV